MKKLLMENETMVRLCCDCHDIVEEISCGTEMCESWSVCQGCGNVEQDTYEVTEVEWEAMG